MCESSRGPDTDTGGRGYLAVELLVRRLMPVVRVLLCIYVDLLTHMPKNSNQIYTHQYLRSQLPPIAGLRSAQHQLASVPRVLGAYGRQTQFQVRRG